MAGLDGRLQGKVALISGGARGQGAAEGRLFAAEGATVYLTDVLTEGRAVADEIGGTFFEHDVTDAATWETITKDIVAEHGHGTGIGTGQPRNDIDQRRLASTIRAQQPEELTAADRQIDALEGVNAPETLAHSVYRNGRRHCLI